MTATDTRQAYAFFRRHAGYVVGRAAQGAHNLAKAEFRAKARVHHGLWRFRWEWDESPGLSWLAEGETVDEVLCCLLEAQCQECGKWRTLQSLCGVCDPDANYRRVIEAELAFEELGE